MVSSPIVESSSSGVRGLVDLLRRFPQRLREPAFWAIQGGVLAVTLLHMGAEMAGIAADQQGFAGQIYHLPVTLYLIPVVAACYVYGMEGGMLTGIWCAILTIPNMVVWHTKDYEWLGELVFVLTVAAIGLVVARPVERERAQRRRAEAVGRRLAFLNHAAATLSDTPHLTQAIERSLDQLVSTLGLKGAAVVAADPGGEDPIQVISIPDREGRPHDVEAITRKSQSPEGLWIVPVTAHGKQIGRLTALTEPEHNMGEEEEAILLAVADQIGVAIDNAALHRQEERRLRSYVRQVTRAQEEERHRIARELHDESVQQLVVLSRDLDALNQDCPQMTNPEGLLAVRQRTSEILTGLRRFSRDLRPAMLDELGLVPALEWLASDLTERTGIDSTFETSGDPVRLPGETEVALFRITQEAIRNIERHADATTIVVRASFHPSKVEVRVVDDGVGFKLHRAGERNQPSQLGILGMQERARLVGGELEIDSVPGAGTTVIIRVPINS